MDELDEDLLSSSFRPSRQCRAIHRYSNGAEVFHFLSKTITKYCFLYIYNHRGGVDLKSLSTHFLPYPYSPHSRNPSSFSSHDPTTILSNARPTLICTRGRHPCLCETPAHRQALSFFFILSEPPALPRTCLPPAQRQLAGSADRRCLHQQFIAL